MSFFPRFERRGTGWDARQGSRVAFLEACLCTAAARRESALTRVWLCILGPRTVGGRQDRGAYDEA